MGRLLPTLASIAIGCPLYAGSEFVPYTSEASLRGLSYLIAAYGSGPGVLGSGLCAADLDSDGDVDIVAMGKASGIIGVFRNSGTGTFTSVVSGIAPMPLGSSVAAGDYDSDGDLDLVFSQMGAPVRLYRNDSQLSFTEVTLASAITGDHAGRTVAWTDYDSDGRIDILLACYTGFNSSLAGSTSRLWRNLGDGTFSDVTASVGLGSAMRTFVILPFDYDHDGDADLYFSNDRGHLAPDYLGNRLYRNDDGHFTDVSVGSGANLGYFSMGIAVGDLDENGLMDLFTTNIASANQPIGAINPLYMAVGAGEFIESCYAWGVLPFIANETGWAAHFFDANNDALLDLYLNNQLTADRFFLHDAQSVMHESAAQVGLSGTAGAAFCSVLADFDGDGGMDVLSNHAGSNIRLLMNNEGRRRSWLSLSVVGEGLNRNAIGARVRVIAQGQTMERQVFAGGTGYLGMSQMAAHVGCASANTATVEVIWPATGSMRTIANLPTAARWSIYPPGQLGDGDRDGDWDSNDSVMFEACAAGGSLNAGCEVFDMNSDSMIDAQDRDLLAARVLRDACDLNNDAQVDALDLATLMANWGGIKGDIDGSGSVDALDLALLLASWG